MLNGRQLLPVSSGGFPSCFVASFGVFVPSCLVVHLVRGGGNFGKIEKGQLLPLNSLQKKYGLGQN